MDCKNEFLIANLIESNDVETLKKLLQNPIGFRLEGKSILSFAVIKGSYDVIKYLIDSGCDIREADTNGDTPLHLLSFTPIPECLHEGAQDQTCSSCKTKSNRLKILEILLSVYSNDADALRAHVFSNANENRMTPFLWACDSGCDATVTRLLSFIDNRQISIDKFVGFHGKNVFHLIVGNSPYHTPAVRMETLRALIEKIQFSDRLVDAKNEYGETPLYWLWNSHRHDLKNSLVIELTKMLLKHGASADADFDGTTLLEFAMEKENASLIEVLLRAGCRTDIYKYRYRPAARLYRVGAYNVIWHSPLFYILRLQWRHSKSELIRVVELFLAFGVNLQKELYLYDTIEELPVEFSVHDHAAVRDMGDVDLRILGALREIRRSNQMLSLQRQCRNTIRRHLKGKADEAIRSLTCVPDPIKSFLLAENEKRLLGIS